MTLETDIEAVTHAAAILLANHEIATWRGDQPIHDPTAYRRSRIPTLTAQWEPFWQILLDRTPRLSPIDLFTAVVDPARLAHQPDPTASQQRALQAQIDRDTTRANAPTCPDCVGGLVIAESDGPATRYQRCPTCTPPKGPAA